MNLTTLARKLEPYIRTMIREMLGDMNSSGLSTGLTWIQGTAIPEDDKSGNRGTGSIDFSLIRNDNDEVTKGLAAFNIGDDNENLGDNCYTFGSNHVVGTNNEYAMIIGVANNIVSSSDYFMAIGYGVTSTSNDIDGSLSLNDGVGTDIGNGIFPISWVYGSTNYISGWAAASAWNGSRNWAVPTDVIWYFDMRIVFAEQGLAGIGAYTITGVVANDGGVVTLHTSTVTVHHRTDATKEFRVTVVATDLELQHRDTAGADATDFSLNVQMFISSTQFDA